MICFVMFLIHQLMNINYMAKVEISKALETEQLRRSACVDDEALVEQLVELYGKEAVNSAIDSLSEKLRNNPQEQMLALSYDKNTMPKLERLTAMKIES
jgi:hypothetical protein